MTRSTKAGRISRTWAALAALGSLALVFLSVSSDLDADTLRVHTALDKTVPAADATVEGPVRELHLIYTTEVQIRLSSVSVEGEGVEVASADLAFLTDSEERGLRLPLSTPLSSGSYTVSWRTAGPDSHPIRGEYSFTVASER